MTQALLFATPGILLALAVIVVIGAFIPTRPSLLAALDRMRRPMAASADDDPHRWDERVGAWVQSRVPGGRFFAVPTTDLRLVGIAPSTFFRNKTFFAALGLVFPSLMGLIFNLIGWFPIALPLALAIPLAVAGWFLPDRDLRRRADSARKDFARSVAVYLELVAAERKRGAPAARALTSAAEVGTTWVFVRIQEELTRARLAGTPPWTALNGLAEEIDVPELADVAKIVRLSGEEGASVAQTLHGRGRTLRTQLLNDEHAQANRASERMSIPLTFLAFVFVGIVLTPLTLNLLS